MPTRQSYVHRGDRARRIARIRKVGLWVALATSLGVLRTELYRDSSAAASTLSFGSGPRVSDEEALRLQLESVRGQLEAASSQLHRAKAVMAFSSRYKVGADLAGHVYDAALAEGIDPELAFRVVRVESEFNPHATSPVGALGLTQLMIGTAREFDKTITKEKLFDAKTNLHLGFRYLGALIKEYKGDVQLALLVYNRGPVAVTNAQALGLDPRNGYEQVVMKGYAGTGLMR